MTFDPNELLAGGTRTRRAARSVAVMKSPIVTPDDDLCDPEPALHERRTSPKRTKPAQHLPEMEPEEPETPAITWEWRLFSAVFGRPTTILGMLALIAVFALYLYAHAISIVSELAAFPPFVRYAGYAGLSALLGVIVAFGLRLMWLWFRLRKTPQISLPELRRLSERSNLRTRAREKTKEAQVGLTTYMSEYPLDLKKTKETLHAFGLTEGDIQFLARERDILLSDSRRQPEEWLEMLNRGFLEPLDRAADSRIKRHAIFVAVKTAGCPHALLDSMIVAHSCFSLIGDLCVIYNLRATGLGGCFILAQAFAHTYFSSHMQGQAEKLIESFEFETPQVAEPEALSSADSVVEKAGESAELGDSVPDAADGHFDWLSDSIIAAAPIAQSVLKKLGAKFGEGAANGILLYRLGKSVKRLLRPIRG